MMNVFSSLKRFIYNFFDLNNDPIDVEPVVIYAPGSKRSHCENTNENVFIKRRKLSPTVEEGIIDVDYFEPPSIKEYSPNMPRRKRSERRNFKPERQNNSFNVSEIIEINDDDAGQSSNKDVHLDLTNDPVDEVDTKNTLHNVVPSTSTNDIEIVDEYPLNSVASSSGLRNFRAPNSIRSFPNNRSQRHKFDDRSLKEMNHRHSVVDSYVDMPSRRSSASSSSSYQSAPNSFKDYSSSLSLGKMRKGSERAVFLNLLKQYANSPNSSKKSSSISSLSDTRETTQFNNSLINRRYPSRFCNSFQEKKTILMPSTSKSSSQSLDVSAFNKTVIDLTSEEDDEQQRQEIISNVISSDLIKNLKTSFVGKNEEIIEEDYIHNLLKKYDAKLRLQESQANKIRQKIREDHEDFNKTISEILEKRLTLKEEVAEQKSSFEIAPITKAMTAAMKETIASKKDPLVQIKDTAVKIQDIYTLEDRAWLNDAVINAYMNLIKMRAEAKPDKYPKVHCFNTFLYEQLQKRGYNSVRRWTKRIDIFDYTMLIVPIHLGNHWCLIQVQLKEKCIRYFDSMGNPNNRCLKTISQYLVDEYKDKKNDNLDVSDWKLMNLPPDEIPQQRNMHDCGVFACTFAEHLTRLAPFNFSQEHMPYFRVKMKYEILTRELLL